MARRRADPDAPPPPWRYPDPFTGDLVQPTDDGDPDRLARDGLPVFANLDQLARAMGRPWPRVLWLANPSSAYSLASPHYHLFTLGKPHGGERLVLAPKPELKAAQRWILRNVLDGVPLDDCVHGFRSGRSIATNAAAHRGRAVVVRFDLRDFFHAVTYRRVRGLFRSLGYSTEASVILALLTTFRPDAFPFTHRRHLSTLAWSDGVGQSRRAYRGFPITPPFLPQGAPTSPAIANLVARRLDRRLAGLAARTGATYTRYADDLTFSGDAELRGALRRFIPLVARIVREEGFEVAPEKRRVHRKGGRQTVTGLVVNDEVGVPRETVRRLRAIIHNAAVHGPDAVRLEGQRLPDPAALRAWLEGWIGFVGHVRAPQGERLRAAFDRIRWPSA